MNKTRTSKVGAISKAQKAQKTFFEKTNIHSVAKYQITKKLKGDPLEEKKSHNAEKLKGGTLWDFPTSLLSQNMKN